ncbi:hypothetical protein CMN24_04060 [Candidatus Saccharibacteria bacterium]|nr:hypothetical protein [Candidatus Saccharibacteria bacterium]|tara:strand:+ start:1967 stop:3505 length:1539 start_codon:yes stop_codon:yes gene_type:complete
MSQPPKLANDFWRSYRCSVVTLIVITEGVMLGATGAFLYYASFFQSHLLAAITILLIQLIVSVLSFLLLYRSISRPFNDLMAAVIHVSGEPTTTTPPNPNTPRYAHNGFRDVLQTVYQLASNDQTTPLKAGSSTTTSPQEFITSALDETSTGFVIMSKGRRIVYANKVAPVDIDQDGASHLSLIFNGKDTLDAWLAECEKSAVHAEHTWTRIANKLPEEENRRFFDVMASYSKGAVAEVVITLADRTSTYINSEQDLDFIAFAAHELRGPITVIRGYLDVLQSELDGSLADDQVELFHRLTVSANRLSGYINNILNTSRYDRRHLKMHPIETTAAAVYDTIRDDMLMRASAQNRLLSVAIPNDLPAIAADPASMSEVFGNLIDNAIKYSNEGSAINVTAAVKGDFVEVSVEDHGIGMPGNVVSNLFQKFYRSHRSRETVAGTGIGLYISKAIVESHGGSIGVRSEEGRGSTFTVSIPTYASVADKLKSSDNSNEGLIDQGNGWIKNHSMYRG